MPTDGTPLREDSTSAGRNHRCSYAGAGSLLSVDESRGAVARSINFSSHGVQLNSTLRTRGMAAWRGTVPCRRHGHASPEWSFSRSRSEEHTSELQSLTNLVCRLL